MKIVYCGYDFFVNCLRGLLADGHEVTRIYTWRGDNRYNFSNEIIELSEAGRIPVYFHRITRADLQNLSKNGCDILVSAAYPYKIPVDGTESFKAINIHPTLLPDGRGPWPLPLLITDHPEASGISIHKLSPEMDAGDIITSRPIKITANETYESLAAKCRLTARDLLCELLADPDFANKWVSAVPQGKGSYWPMPSDDEQMIRWEWPVAKIDAFVRSFGKCECVGRVGSEKYDIQRVSVWPASHKYEPGTLVLNSGKEIVIAAKDGLVCLTHFCRSSP